MTDESSALGLSSDETTLIVGLSIASLLLLGTGVYLGYSNFVARPGAVDTGTLVSIVLLLVCGAILGARALMVSTQ